jgi:toxin ParE1/3/4
MWIEWTRPAADDLDRIIEFIGQDDLETATAVARRIMAAVRPLARLPLMGRPGKVPGTRELLVPGLPYLLPYVASSDRVSILRVLHSRQDWPQAAR